MRKRILFILAVSCLALAIATPPALADVVNLSTLTLVGTSQIMKIIPEGKLLRLTDNTDLGFNPDPKLSSPSPAGAAWTPTTYNVVDPFSVDFHFRMSDPIPILPGGNGGDGIAFLIQNDAPNAIGVGAGGMGFLGITDSVAVMLDTYQNDSKNFYGDPSNNYISVNTRGKDFNAPHHFCTNGLLATPDSGGSDLTGSSFSDACEVSPTLGMATIDPTKVDNMDDGKVHDLEVIYTGKTGQALDIYLDSALILAVSLNLGTELNLQGGTNAFLGFTAGTRFAYQNQDILDFTITPEPVWDQLWVPLAMILAVALARKRQRGRS